MVISKDEYYSHKTKKLVEEEFNDSLGDFITSYLKDRKLTVNETQQLTALLESVSEKETGK